MLRRTFYRAALVLALGLLATLVGSAQVLTSRVDGTVRDQTGAVIPGVEVTLTNKGTNASRSTVTNDSGLFIFPQVSQGFYRVTAQLPGFRTAVVEDVEVDVGSPTTVDVGLEIGEVSEEVVVAANLRQPVMNAVTAELNTIANEEQIESLPTNRNPLQVAYIQAGVTGTADTARSLGEDGGGASINGMRGTYNNITLDGMNNQDNFIRTDAFFPEIPLVPEFIEELNLTTSNSDATSSFGASQTQFITRSGTNEYHGSLYYYHKNDALNANEFFNNAVPAEEGGPLPKPRLLDHEYGGTIGGPILADKLFFFFGTQLKETPSTTAVSRTVLFPQAKQGDFTYVRQDNGQLQTVNLFDLTGISPDPLVQSILGMAPAPNDPSRAGDGRNTGGFRFNNDSSSESNQIVLRLDYQVSDAHTLMGTFQRFRLETPNRGFDIGSMFPGLPGAGSESTRRQGTVSLRSIFSPNVTNEFRFGFLHSPSEFFNAETFDQGFIVEFQPNPNRGTCAVCLDNPVQTFLPQGRVSPVYELMDSVDWVKGDHTFSFGFNTRWSNVDSFNDAGIIPSYFLGWGAGNTDPLVPELFAGGIGPSDLANASEILSILGGFVADADQSFNVTSQDSGFVPGATNARNLKQNFLTLYGGDTWRITPEFSLNYGLSWEYHGVPFEADGLALLPVNGLATLLDPMGVIDFAGPDGARHFMNEDWNNFAPNIGVAWRFSDATVFRGGYGIEYVIDNTMTVVTNALRGNDGLQQQVVEAGISGTISGQGRVPIEQPEFKVPRTALDQITADPFAAMFSIDPDMKVPYVQQWNLGIQHELLPDTAVEVRYVGHHGIGLSRSIDVNQVRFPQEFIADFQRAQRNLAANGDPTVGEELTFFPTLGLGGFLQSGFVQSLIRNGEIGQYVGAFLAPNRAFFFDGWGGENFGATATLDPFYANPNIWPADFVGNNSFSKYNSLQAEIRRRFRSGLAFQVNYTYGKTLTDYSGTTQSAFRGHFDINQTSLEVMRPSFDVTHTINGNWLLEVPVGRGRRFLMDAHPVVNGILGGWNLNGLLRIRSGEPINIISNRGTINRGGSRALTNTVHLRGIDIPELQDRTGLFKASDGTILLFDPSLIGPDGRANPEFFQNPGLLEAGTLGLSPVSGPWYSTVDLSIQKQFPLPFTEGSLVEFRFDMFNLFNRTNFDIESNPSFNDALDDLGVNNIRNINQADFGVIDETFRARQMQVGLKIKF